MQMLTRGVSKLMIAYRKDMQKEESRDNDLQPTKVNMRIQERQYGQFSWKGDFHFHREAANEK